MTRTVLVCLIALSLVGTGCVSPPTKASTKPVQLLEDNPGWANAPATVEEPGFFACHPWAGYALAAAGGAVLAFAGVALLVAGVSHSIH